MRGHIILSRPWIIFPPATDYSRDGNPLILRVLLWVRPGGEEGVDLRFCIAARRQVVQLTRQLGQLFRGTNRQNAVKFLKRNRRDVAENDLVGFGVRFRRGRLSYRTITARNCRLRFDCARIFLSGPSEGESNNEAQGNPCGKDTNRALHRHKLSPPKSSRHSFRAEATVL